MSDTKVVANSVAIQALDSFFAYKLPINSQTIQRFETKKTYKPFNRFYSFLGVGITKYDKGKVTL